MDKPDKTGKEGDPSKPQLSSNSKGSTQDAATEKKNSASANKNRSNASKDNKGKKDKNKSKSTTATPAENQANQSPGPNTDKSQGIQSKPEIDMASMIQSLVDANKKMLADMVPEMVQSVKKEIGLPQTVSVVNQGGSRKISEMVPLEDMPSGSGTLDDTDQGNESVSQEDNPHQIGEIELHPNYEHEDLGLNQDFTDDNSQIDPSKGDSADGLSEAGVTDISGDVQWTSILSQLPQYYDGKLELEGDTSQAHTSYVADTFQSGKKNKVPKLPLDGVVKQKWDEIEGFMKRGSISAYRSSDHQRFRIYESDFEKYGRTPSIDQEYRAKIEFDGSKFGKPGGTPKKGQPPIKDTQLRIVEAEFQKCDESARLALRASSHGALMLNAMHTILNDPQKYEQGEIMNLLQGAFKAFQTVADSAVRVTARSIMARRRICLSQVSFKDSNANKELMALPMGGQFLFQGQFSEIMHKYATFSRDARETSDYASPVAKAGQKRSYGQGFASGPAFKKQAMAQNPGFAEAKVQVQGQNRKIIFKKGPANKNSGGGTGQRFQFRKKQYGKGPRQGQQY